jgi:hypothetical protein
MKSYVRGFNIYLALASLFLAAGCSSWSKAGRFAKQEKSTIRFYLEGNRTDTSDTGTVLVTRERIPYIIQREPFLTEADLTKATMVEEPGPNGGYAIELVFDDHGALMLDMMTTANRGKHIVILSQFPPPAEENPKGDTKPKKSDDTSDMQMRETLPDTHPELERPGHPRTSGWLAAVLVRQRNPSGIFRFSPDASHDETARIVRGLKNVITYERALEKD